MEEVVSIPLTEAELNVLIASLEGSAQFVIEADGVKLADLLTKLRNWKEHFPHA
jgi:hypothetical protein